MSIDIEQVREITTELQHAFALLLPQLSPRFEAPAADVLRRVVSNPCTVLFAARFEGRIVGVLTLSWYDTPSGRKGWIEDVVVDAAARGCGAGRALVEAALAEARRVDVATLTLTSSPKRVAAHALYRKMGFETVDTTVFRLKIE